MEIRGETGLMDLGFGDGGGENVLKLIVVMVVQIGVVNVYSYFLGLTGLTYFLTLNYCGERLSSNMLH